MSRRLAVGIASLLLVAAGAGASIIETRHLTWSYVTASQLLANDSEAFLIIRVRQAGWRGSEAGYLWQVVRNDLYAPTETIDTVESLCVLRYRDGAWTEQVIPSSRLVLPRILPVDAELYVVIRGDRQLWERWTGQGFEPVSDFEVIEGNLAWRAEHDPGNQWSSVWSVVTFAGAAPRRIRVPRHPVTLVVTTDFKSGMMQVDSESDSGHQTRIWSKNDGIAARHVDRATYQRIFTDRSASQHAG